jgi:hypothetical protein
MRWDSTAKPTSPGARGQGRSSGWASAAGRLPDAKGESCLIGRECHTWVAPTARQFLARAGLVTRSGPAAMWVGAQARRPHTFR